MVIFSICTSETLSERIRKVSENTTILIAESDSNTQNAMMIASPTTKFRIVDLANNLRQEISGYGKRILFVVNSHDVRIKALTAAIENNFAIVQ